MKNKKTGFSLIELLFVIVIFGIVAVFLTSFMASRSRSIELLNDSKAASDSLENALKELSRLSYSDLPVAVSFTVVDQGTVELGSCSPQSCDYVVQDYTSDTPPLRSIAGGYLWNYGSTTVQDATVVFFRRWSVEEIDADLRLKRLTVAVFSDQQSSHPLVMITTVIGEY